MADNTTINSGSGGDSIRDIDRSGSGPKTQVVALDVMGTGATEAIGLVAPDTVVVSSSGLTTATTAYTSGDVLGAELTFTVGRLSGRGVVITSASLVDKAKVIGAVDAYIFDRASTPASDNAANSWADADMANLLGIINFPAPTASALNSAAIANAGIPLIAKGNSSTDIKIVLVTRSGHTFFGAATDLVLRLGIEPA